MEVYWNPLQWTTKTTTRLYMLIWYVYSLLYHLIPCCILYLGIWWANPLTNLLTNLMALMARGSCQRRQHVLRTETVVIPKLPTIHSTQHWLLWLSKKHMELDLWNAECWKIGNNHQFLSCQCFFHVFSTMLSHQLQMYGIFTRR